MLKRSKVILQNREGTITEGTAEILIFSKAESRKRALKVGALFLALAGVAVFLPLVHFILVPLFLLLSPLSLFLLQKQTSKLLRVEGKCPRCQNLVTLCDQPDAWPQETACDHCREVVVFLAPPSGASET